MYAGSGVWVRADKQHVTLASTKIIKTKKKKIIKEREKQKNEWTTEWGGGKRRKSQPIFPAAESISNSKNNNKGKGARNAVIKTTIEHSYD